MKTIFQKPKVTPPNGRNGFDVSQRQLFSCCVGQLLPTYSEFCTAGDVIKITADTKVRTEAVETAAFTRFTLHNEYFFVPMRQLYQFWNEFYNQTFDAHTSFVEIGDDFTLPRFDISALLTNPETISSVATNDANTKTATLILDDFGIPKLWNFRRLLSMMQYGSASVYRGKAYTTFAANPLLRFLTYHRIFYSHYNNSDWFIDKPYMYNVDNRLGSTVSVTNSTTMPLITDIVTTLHYRPWRKDFFNNIYPTPTFSQAFGNYLQESFIDGQNLRDDVNPEYVNSNGLGQTTELGAYLGVATNQQLAKINSADLRSVFALDKMLRITALAGSHYDEQTLAHLGVKIPDGLAKEAYFIGADSTDINVSEVVASATTNAFDSSNDEIIPGSVIGDIAGKAFGASGGKTVDFKCPEDGIVMCITSIEPILDYSSKTVDPTNLYKNSFDFFHPEFDNLGMQPFDNAWLTGQFRPTPLIVGWMPRYSELKTKFDIVHESVSESDKKHWQTNYQDSNYENGFQTYDKFARFYIFPQYTNTIFGAATQRFNTTTHPAKYTYRGDEDKGFYNSFNLPINVYSGDNFIVCINFNAFKTSIMSVHSIPKIS